MSKKSVCPICDKIFQYENDLKKHLESKTAHVRKKPHTCCVCGKLFRNKALLAVHELIHEEKKGNLEKMERIFSCPHCSYIAVFKTALKNHIKPQISTRNRNIVDLFLC
jgi:uncharacterized C2H2 Zn-finger protein